MSSETLRALLEARDQKEKQPFENLIFTINEYASELESSLILVDSLKAALKRARFAQRDEIGNTSNSNSELEAKLKELKEERAELYRQQGTQATHLLSLNDQLRQKDSVITQQSSEIANLKAVQEQRDEELRKLREALREKEEGAKVIGDELVALQLELLRLDQWQSGGKPKEKSIDSPEDALSTVPTAANAANNDSNVSLVAFNTNANNLKLTKEKEITAPHQYPISSYASNAMKHQLLTGSEDQKIILYDLTRISTKMVLKWSKMNGPIVALAVDEEGKMAASCSAYDKEVTIWSLASGKIQGTLAFSDDSNELPLLHFGAQSRLWMSLGRTVRLWDCQRGLLFRSWNKDQIGSSIAKIVADGKRPDRVWCFDVKGCFGVLNAVNGKLEVPWTALIDETNNITDIIYACSKERVIVGRRANSNDNETDWTVTGFAFGGNGSMEGVFEFNLRSDLHVDDQNTDSLSLSIHPTRPDLFAIIMQSRVLIVKVSSDNWNPETLLIDDIDTDSASAGDSVIQWGPEEIDSISGERGCKVVLIGKESKGVKLYTLSRI